MTTRREPTKRTNFITRFIDANRQRRANRKRMDSLRHHTAIGTPVSKFNAAQTRDQGSFEAARTIVPQIGHA